MTTSRLLLAFAALLTALATITSCGGGGKPNDPQAIPTATTAKIQAVPRAASATAAPENWLVPTTVHNFRRSDPTDGAIPYAGVTQDKDGNLYGITRTGGANFSGAVFKITPAGVETIIHSIDAAVDGNLPNGRLVLADDGNFYGTMVIGGMYGKGTIFRLKPDGTFTTLRAFGGADGAEPHARLIQSRVDGKLYGSTKAGGAKNGGGTLFSINTDGTDFTVLYSFTQVVEGYAPTGALVEEVKFDPLGQKIVTFYGTTNNGGTRDTDYNEGRGTVFRFKLTAAPVTIETLYTFRAPGGQNPTAGLTDGGDGHYYGTTFGGGSQGQGTIFRFNPNLTAAVAIQADAAVNLETIHEFPGDEAEPYSGLTLGSDGNLYGTTLAGSSSSGSIYQLRDGVVSTLYRFVSNAVSGEYPYGELFQASDGMLYGTAHLGGLYSSGIVYKFTPLPCGINDKDTDGDGLCDSWEKPVLEGGGVKDANGNVILDLHSMGADPYVKDIFVQVDYMKAPGVGAAKVAGTAVLDYRLRKEAADLVIAAFKAQGISLHIDCGSDCEMKPGALWGALSKARDVASISILEMPAGNTSLPLPFYSIRDGSLSSERIYIFHYALMGHQLKTTEKCGGTVYPSGMASTPGSDILVTLGGSPLVQNSGSYATNDDYIFAQAGTFMHELGHNLGLAHGGPLKHSESDPSVNYTFKPNHFSVMNYSFQTGISVQTIGSRLLFPWINPRVIMDYSQASNPTLFEDNGLDEIRGVGGSSSISDYIVIHYCQSPALPKKRFASAGANRPIDWNCSSPQPQWNSVSTGIDAGLIKSNINDDKTCVSDFPPSKDIVSTPLTSYAEWDSLKLKAGRIGKPLSGTAISVEFFPFEADSGEIFGNPVIQRFQKGDLNGDGNIDLADLQILNSFMNTKSPPGTTPGEDRRDLNGDGKIDALDARLLTTLCTKPRCAR
jgi:uncharacterized repeat protein (TIGR03803 family)